MRLTIGKKLNGLIVTLQLLSISGVVVMATQLFTSDLVGLLRKGTLDTSSMLAGRVRAEMKHVADRARMLGAASLEDFRYAEDRLRFIQDNLAVDPQYVGVALFRHEAAPSAEASAPLRWAPQWRVVHPEVLKRLDLKASDFETLDREFPLDFDSVGRGQVDFTVGKLKDGTPTLRMAIPFVRRNDGSFSQLLVVELQQERLTSLFSDSTEYTSYLVDRRGIVLGSNDPMVIQVGESLGALPIVRAAASPTQSSGQRDFTDGEGELQMGAYQQVGFAGLSVVAQVPMARATMAQNQLYRRTAFLAGAFLCLALALGFAFSQSLVRPIRALADAARRVKDGDFSVRLPAKTRTLKDGSVVPAPGDEIQGFSGTFNEMVYGLEERDKVKRTFEKFHSKEMAEKVLSGELKLGGERKTAYVFFSDVRGFTAMSENLDPEALVRILNRYMSRMVKCILESGGIVDKYVGDAIMAVWGAPVAKENDGYNAIMACLNMRRSLDELNEEFEAEGLPLLRIGMGLNYGPLIAGNIGSDERMEYTVIGDTVNTASRIESITKTFGTDLLISREVLDQVVGRFVVEKAHEAKVKGKSEPLVVYKVHGFVDEEGRDVLVETPYSSYAAEKSDKVEGGSPHPDAPPEEPRGEAHPSGVARPLEVTEAVRDEHLLPMLYPESLTEEELERHPVVVEKKEKVVRSAQDLPPGIPFPGQATDDSDTEPAGQVESGADLGGLPLDASRSIKVTALEAMLRALTWNLTFDQLLRELLLAVLDSVKSEAGTFLELDPKGRNLEARCFAGYSASGMAELKVSPTLGLVGAVVQSRSPGIVTDAVEQMDEIEEFQNCVDFGIRNMAALPVFVNRELFGVLVLVNRIGEDEFDPDTVELLTYLAGTFGKMIEARCLLMYGTPSPSFDETRETGRRTDAASGSRAA